MSKNLNNIVVNAKVMLAENEYMKYMSDKMDDFEPKTEKEIIVKNNIIELLKMVEDNYVEAKLLGSFVSDDIKLMIQNKIGNVPEDEVQSVVKSNVLPFVRKIAK